MNHTDRQTYADTTLAALMERIPAIAELTGNRARIDELYAAVKPTPLAFRDGRVNLDVYESQPNDPVLIFHTGICNYSRFYFVFLALLAEQGFNVIAVDRPGHGFSDGLRGDCAVEDVKELMPAVIDYAHKTYNDKIGLFGTSLGGITTFYLLPDIEGVKSALCHNWIYPGELADPKKWLLNAVLRQLNKIKPRMAIPVRKLVDPKKVQDLSAQQPLVRYFESIHNDPIYCQSLTLRSVASYFGGYQPLNEYGSVDLPVLGLISEYEKVLPLQTSRQWWARAAIPNSEIKIIEKSKHMIFHDAIPAVLPIVADWFKKTLNA